MSDIDRIVAKWSGWYWETADAHADEAIRAALLEYGAIVLEECAKECETIGQYWWSEYKTGASRGNSYTEGLADGGAECAAAIRITAALAHDNSTELRSLYGKGRGK